jgi:hypothetical protein
MRRARFHAWIATFALALTGCSLVLPRLSAPSCDSDGDCQTYNLRFPERVTACNRYQCNEAIGRCVIGPIDRDGDGHSPIVECGGDDCDDDRADVFGGNVESCDGIDNDCDDVIDDATPIERGAAVAVASVGTLESIAWSEDDAGAVTLASIGTSADLGHVDAASGTTGDLLIRALVDPTDLSQPNLTGEGCPATSGGVPSLSCRLNRVAVSAGSPLGWAAFVNLDGCADGQLRVGLLDPAGPTLELMGPDARSNTWRGVDLSGACTRRAAGTGATAPAIVAATDAGGTTAETAVVAWVRDVATRACGAAPAEVAAMGLWRATGTAGGTAIDWVVATDAGVPELVGMTPGIAPPALVATGTGEVIIAFADAAGGVRVTVLESLPTVAAAPDPTSTPPLSLGESVVVGSGDADDVALTVSPSPGGGLRIGVAWAGGCGGGALRFAPVVWQRAARTLTPAAVIELAASGARQPTLTYVPHGFVRPTASRGGAPVGDDDGGWLLAWRDETMTPPAVVAARVLGADGSVLDAVALPFARDLSSDPRSPFLYAGPASEGGRSARVGLHAADATALVGATLLCPPS